MDMGLKGQFEEDDIPTGMRTELNGSAGLTDVRIAQ